MTWLGQVRHVMRKDLAEDRALMLGYAAFVLVVAIFSAATRLGTSNGPLQMLPYLVVLGGMVVVASLVQMDSPVRPDAFWASRPFHSSAMFVAKIGSAVCVVLLLPLIGQLVVSTVNGATIQQLPSVLAEPAVEYGLWLLIAIVVAALTRDLKSFLVALLVIVLGIVVSLLVVRAWTVVDIRPVRSLAAVVSATSGFGLVGWLYRTREVRLRTWLAAVAITGMIIVVLGARSMGEDPIVEAPPSIPRAQLQLELMQTDGSWLHREEILIGASLGPVDELHQLVFGITSKVVHLRDGSSVTFPSTPGGYADLGRLTQPAIGSGLRWLGERSAYRPWVPIGFHLTREQTRIFGSQAKSIEIAGRVKVLRLRVAATVPLVQGGMLARDGRRIRIDSWSHAQGEGRLTLATVELGSVVPVLDGRGREFPQLDYALLNERRGELLALVKRNGRGGQAMQVLPTPSTSYQLTELNVAAPDDAWLQDAKLIVIERMPIGGYAVRGRLELPASN